MYRVEKELSGFSRRFGLQIAHARVIWGQGSSVPDHCSYRQHWICCVGFQVLRSDIAKFQHQDGRLNNNL